MDEVMAELRRIREQLARECDYDAAKYVESVREEQRHQGRTVVKREPRRIKPVVVASEE
jgi:hypothetical protein